MNEIEVAWLAGLLEGEGCFHLRKEDDRPLIKLNMTDRDVIERAARLMGATYSFRPRAEPHHKDQFVIYLTGPRAQAVMDRVRPYMCARRTAAIEAAIGLPKASLF